MNWLIIQNIMFILSFYYLNSMTIHSKESNKRDRDRNRKNKKKKQLKGKKKSLV